MVLDRVNQFLNTANVFYGPVDFVPSSFPQKFMLNVVDVKERGTFLFYTSEILNHVDNVQVYDGLPNALTDRRSYANNYIANTNQTIYMLKLTAQSSK